VYLSFINIILISLKLKVLLAGLSNKKSETEY